MADTYFQLVNDNNVVVIDDTYQNLSFVHTSDHITVQPGEERTRNGLEWWQLSDGSYGKYETYSRVYTFAELGLSVIPSYIGIRRVDSISGGYTIVAAIAVDNIGFIYRIYSMDVYATYQIVAYAYPQHLSRSSEGLQIFNANGGLVFDAARGFMQVMDSQYHLRDLYSDYTQSFWVYNSNLPDVDFGRMYLISSQRPYATTGGTIIINSRQYVPKLRKDGSNQIYVDLGMWGNIGGSILQQYQPVFSFMVAYVPF